MMKTSESALLDRFNRIIENSFHKPDFSIDEICVELGTSRSQLYRHIKEQTQLSTSLYIRQRKLIRAKELLESTDMKTVEIAYQLGIDSPQNFSKYFVQEFGITPTAYRKLAQDHRSGQVLEVEHTKSAVAGAHDVAGATIAELPAPTAKKTLGPKSLISLFAAAFILLLAAGGYIWKISGEEKPADLALTAFSGNSIAILPFTNLGQPDTDYFCEGIMDQIHGSLARINNLKIISTTSSGKYKNSQKLAPQIGQELDVQYLLEGSVLHEGNKIRIQVELIRSRDDRTVWTKSYDGDSQDVFAYLSAVAKEVAGELDQKLSNALEERLTKSPTVNPQAYREYLKASQLIVSRKQEQMEESIARLDKAIEYDPKFADAYSKRAMAYYLLGESAFLDEQKSYRLSEQNSLTAIRLDPENALAYANLANIYRAQNKWEQARTAYEIALKYSPNDAVINYWFALLLTDTGDIKEALRYSSRAIALDPLYHVVVGGTIMIDVFAGELEMARRHIEDGKVLFKDSWVYHWNSAFYYAAKKDFKQTIRCYDRANQLNPGIRSIEYQRAYFLGLDGQVDEARKYLDQLPDTPVYDVARSVVYAGLNDKKQSLYYFKKAAELDVVISHIKMTPFVSVIRDEPEFKATLTKLGL